MFTLDDAAKAAATTPAAAKLSIHPAANDFRRYMAKEGSDVPSAAQLRANLDAKAAAGVFEEVRPLLRTDVDDRTELLRELADSRAEKARLGGDRRSAAWVGASDGGTHRRLGAAAFPGRATSNTADR